MSGGKCLGGKCLGGKCLGGKCLGVHVQGGYVLEPYITCQSFKPIFHQNATYLALGTFASPNAKNSTSASPNARIPTCWYILR